MNGLRVRLVQRAPIPLDATFECAPGEVLALVGPSGSGKSTILRAIAGTYRASGGTIEIDGAIWFRSQDDISLPPHRRAVGMVFQSYALFPHMTALANVTAAMGHVTPAERERRARSILELVHLGGLESRRPAELSGGQQQRVAVARALAREPKVLLLDEPFSAVDKTTRHHLYTEIAELRRILNMPVVLVTHDLDEAHMLADRVAVLDHGRTLQTGTPEEVTTRPASPAVARLLNLRNVFAAEVTGHDMSTRRTMIAWAGTTLATGLRPELPIGARVSWVIPEGYIVLHRRETATRSADENPVPGIVDGILLLGQNALISLRPLAGGSDVVHFTLPLRIVRRSGLSRGAQAAVSLLAEGIHLMPAP
jgi:molybdate transport system ATP-binding protein